MRVSRRWNKPEDGQPAISRTLRSWSDDQEQLVWLLEVRELSAVGSYRLGEVRLRGSFSGMLVMAIEPTELFGVHDADQ